MSGASEATDSNGLSDNELSKILNEVSVLMAASGQRQSSAMQNVRQRINELSNEAHDAGQALPGDERDTFQRIANAMSDLADRVSEEPEAPQPAISSAPMRDAPDVGEALELSPGSAPSRQDQYATASEAPDDARTYTSRHVAAPSDQAHEIVANPDEPWDETSAEQLTRLYESSGFDAQPAQTPEVAAPLSFAPPSAPSVAPVASQPGETVLPPQRAGITAQDRTWLSDQFSEIAANIELNFGSSDRYDTAIQSIEQRLDALEGLVRTAVQDGATRSDVASLADIETVIFEFAAQFEKTQAELARIEGLEAEITTLAGRLSEERVEAMAAVTAQSPDPLDAERVAEFVASRVAEQSAEAVAGIIPADPDGTLAKLNELKNLLDEFILKHRNEGQQTVDRLDNIEAGVRELLERSDTAALNLQREQLVQEAWSEQDDAGDVRSQASPAASVQPQPQREREVPGGQSKTELTSADPLFPYETAAIDSTDHVEFPAANTGASLQSHVANEPTLEHIAEISDADPVASAADSMQVQSPQRDDFMAQARRAAAKANERAEQQGLEANRPQNRMATREAAAAGSKPRTSRIRSALAMLAIILLAFGATSLFLGWSGQSLTSLIGLSHQTPSWQPAKVAVAPKPRPARQPDRPGGSVPPQAQEVGRDRRPLPQISLPTQQTVPTSLNPVLPRTQGDQTGAALGNPNAQKKLPPALVGPLSLRLAAANGNPSAAFEVGARLAEGKGIEQDFREAAKWYTRSAAAGFALAQYRLATLYERGLGVEKDTSRAKVWYERAAEQGNVKAMHNLAVLSAGGNSGKADYGSAARWFGEAAERGLTDSQFNLAILYQNGLGLRQDFNQAFQWFAIAARLGDKAAGQRRDTVLREITPASADKIKATVANWRAKPTKQLANDARYAGSLWRSQSTASSRQE